MASVTKTSNGYRAQVYVKGVRDSQVFRTKREADAWAAARETSLRAEAIAAPGDKHTLAEALTKYSEEVSPIKRGARWENVRIAAMLKSPIFPVGLIGKITPEIIGQWRDERLKMVSAGRSCERWACFQLSWSTRGSNGAG